MKGVEEGSILRHRERVTIGDARQCLKCAVALKWTNTCMFADAYVCPCACASTYL